MQTLFLITIILCRGETFWGVNQILTPLLVYKVIYCGYFEAARSLGKRSLLNVNEHLTNKADAKRAEQITLYTRELKIVANNR